MRVRAVREAGLVRRSASWSSTRWETGHRQREVVWTGGQGRGSPRHVLLTMEMVARRLDLSQAFGSLRP